MKVLAIAGHADDIELGAGGSILKHTSAGDEVTLLLVTHSEYCDYNGNLVRSRIVAASEAQTAANIMGINNIVCLDYETKEVLYTVKLIEDLNRVIDDLKPDIIYTHWHGDANQDHSAIAHATVIAARNTPRVLMYRSNWNPTVTNFEGNFIVDISDYMEGKIRAIKAHRSEVAKRGPNWVEYFTNQNRNTGIENRTSYAEEFEVVRWVI
jgi:LmbE family N-acetylglucosaminyl deacetylase